MGCVFIYSFPNVSSDVNTFMHRYYATIRSWHEECLESATYNVHLCGGEVNFNIQRVNGNFIGVK